MSYTFSTGLCPDKHDGGIWRWQVKAGHLGVDVEARLGKLRFDGEAIAPDLKGTGELKAGGNDHVAGIELDHLSAK